MEKNREEIFYHFGDFPAYVAREHLSDYPNMSGIGHWHEDVEFVVMTEGEMTYWVDGTSYRLEKDQGMFINARQIHYGYSADGKGGEFVCVRFHPSLIGVTEEVKRKYVLPVTGKENRGCLFLQPDIPEQKEMMEFLCRARILCEKRAEELELELASIFLKIWRLLCRQMKISGADEREQDHRLPGLYQMMEFIQNNYGEKITLADIAREGKMCKSSCCKVFQEYLHKSPVAYLMEYRIRKSMEMLDFQLAITEVALNCGFSGASYYAETFRRIAGITPGEYRRRCRNLKKEMDFTGGGSRTR
ncbi:MAG: helix-turn-helix transcriptional regulator [Clostridiales bacterium]|nr:helix-turn-helix transcriptional regulator [Clostridiales bacterium]